MSNNLAKPIRKGQQRSTDSSTDHYSCCQEMMETNRAKHLIIQCH